MARFDDVIRELPAWIRAGEHGVISFRVGSAGPSGDTIRLAIDLESEAHRDAAQARFASWELTNHSRLPFKLHWNTFVLPVERFSRDKFFGRCHQSLETICGGSALVDSASARSDSGRIQLSF
jgi:hypothetical protein